MQRHLSIIWYNNLFFLKEQIQQLSKLYLLKKKRFKHLWLPIPLWQEGSWSYKLCDILVALSFSKRSNKTTICYDQQFCIMLCCIQIVTHTSSVLCPLSERLKQYLFQITQTGIQPNLTVSLQLLPRSVLYTKEKSWKKKIVVLPTYNMTSWSWCSFHCLIITLTVTLSNKWTAAH